MPLHRRAVPPCRLPRPPRTRAGGVPSPPRPARGAAATPRARANPRRRPEASCPRHRGCA
ncbi:MAG: hypothetical protein FJ260_04285 [Planctomycetes bacterium]|nr:hypothetical protein [Planctomycetota bacterium]